MEPLWKTLKPGPKEKFPDEIYVIVEVSKGSREKYELDKKTRALFLDRNLLGNMVYPGDYGSIPETLAKDNDPVDVLILTASPHQPGIIIEAKPIGLLKMEDEKGQDDKIICITGKSKESSQIKDLKDVSKEKIKEIENFFKHYKELETGKWTRIKKWHNAKTAKKYISTAHKTYKQKYEKNINQPNS